AISEITRCPVIPQANNCWLEVNKVKNNTIFATVFIIKLFKKFKSILRIGPKAIQCNNPWFKKGNQSRPILLLKNTNFWEFHKNTRSLLSVIIKTMLIPGPFLTQFGFQNRLILTKLLK